VDKTQTLFILGALKIVVLSHSSLPFTYIIYGPTGVGKTDFALALAQEVPSEIINMDMGQLYVPFSIGTAKPDWRTQPVVHHLFDVITAPTQEYTVVQYRAACLALIHDIWQRGKLPILVGGSGFYLKSLFFPPRMGEKGEALYDIDILEENKKDWWSILNTYDPERAQAIDKNDFYRLERALTLLKTTGCKPSLCVPVFDTTIRAHISFLGRDRADLYARINHRVDLMLEAGWHDEVAALMGTPWETFIKNKKLIGYNELCELMQDASLDYARMVCIIKQRTRHYAKRQFTFWRTLAKEISECSEAEIGMESVNVTVTDCATYIKELIRRLPLLKER
jgi:tRNA dimethylallyltransferase